MREGGDIQMLLRAHTYVRVAIGDLRSRMHDRLVDLTRSEVGATAAEYALLVSLIAVVLVAGAFLLGGAINDRLDATADCIDSAPAASCPVAPAGP
jgi:pilus assembly protein Flp/PilA